MATSLRVLIVDDDETLCRLFAEVLEHEGMEAIWSTDGLAGYKMFAHELYDLFILDVRMPLVLGTELAEVLKEANPRAKIILVSAFADDALLKISKSIGVPLLSKPFAAEHLIEVVRATLRE